MRQKTFSSGFEKHTKKTRKERFLEEMDQEIPWTALAEGLAPYYPNPQGAGRRPRLMNVHLAEKGLQVAHGTIVDATIINVPSSTKNQDGERDPEIHQTKKGNQWYFGLKAHIGVDSDSKLVHSSAVTAANVHDSQVLADLLHGDETRVWGDSAYTGQGEVLAEHAPKAQDFTHTRGRCNATLTEAEARKNRTKSKVRAKVEHVFRVLKCQFSFTKVRYRGLAKNANHLFAAFALVNIVLSKRHLLRQART